MILLQCATSVSYAAKGHTTNNGGNLAEIRFTDAWKRFEARMAPCRTPQNLCGLDSRQRAALDSALHNKAQRTMTLPSEVLLYRAGGEPKSEDEMFEVILAELQDCGDALSASSLQEITSRALSISEFSGVKLFRGQDWFVFQRNGLFVEFTGGVQDFTPKFRSLLRLAPGALVKFESVSVRNNGGLIEIGGRLIYEKGIERSNRFTLLINPYENGTIPERTDLTVFQ